MVHISLICLKFIQTVDFLRVSQRSQCRNSTNLCLSACKHCRTMYSRNQIHFCCQRTDFFDCSSVWTFVIFENHFADSFLLVLIYSLSQNSQPLFILSKCFFEFLRNLTDVFFSLLFLVCEDSYFHFFRRNDLFDCCKQFFRNGTAFVCMFRFSALCYNFLDKCDDFLIYFMCLINRLNHNIFFYFVRTCLNHDHFFFCGSYRKLKIRNFFHSQRRIDDKLTIYHTYLCRCTRSVKRNIRNTGCDGGTQHGRNLRIAFRIYRHNHVI